MDVNELRAMCERELEWHAADGRERLNGGDPSERERGWYAIARALLAILDDPTVLPAVNDLVEAAEACFREDSEPEPCIWPIAALHDCIANLKTAKEPK